MALEWLTGRHAESRPVNGGRGGAAALEYLAERIQAGLDDRTRTHLVNFAIRVGVRRLADASVWLGAVDETQAATVADQQARLLGSVQCSLVTGDVGTAAAALRQMAGTYDRLCTAMASPSTT
ncbi:hypothetical protein [Streptomyces sp. ME19-01-6]|uniref:hypothetical protein n=1 Tax=Streptomyces sp. ME19-01-6 TaxID=3028686 RepID=UPI0029BB80EB|nr:hypothetical protein [Streptomyces sp. ME19-01-6]MDX3229922.1 hypothetical protein [Streptomyces sp. ME19-01-6]